MATWLPPQGNSWETGGLPWAVGGHPEDRPLGHVAQGSRPAGQPIPQSASSLVSTELSESTCSLFPATRGQQCNTRPPEGMPEAGQRALGFLGPSPS